MKREWQEQTIFHIELQYLGGMTDWNSKDIVPDLLTATGTASARTKGDVSVVQNR